jgi:hypothetical protein
VSTASWCIFIAGIALEVLLICRLSLDKIWRRYPYFFAYVVFVIVQTVVLYAIFRLARSFYVPWYLNSGMVNLWARFLVVWEVFRHTFPSRSSLRRIVSGGFTAALLLVGTLLAAMTWGIQTYGRSHSVYRALDRSFGFAQAVLILLVLIVARYYHVELGRNVWGMAVAFGMYSSLSTANSAFVDMFHFFFPYWALIGPLSLVVMLTMWTWSVWTFYPNPVVVGAGAVADNAHDLREWAEGWGQTVSTVRKVMNP